MNPVMMSFRDLQQAERQWRKPLLSDEETGMVPFDTLAVKFSVEVGETSLVFSLVSRSLSLSLS